MASTVSGTRRFESPEEIEREVGFVAQAPIDVATYDELIGWYAFSDEKLRCCVARDSGNLCLTQHGRGWVARRKDGVATLIGSDCAKDKFAAGSIAIGDIRRAENEIARRDRESRLGELLADRDTKVVEIEGMISSLRELGARLDHLAREIGPQVWARVQLQAASGSAQVSIQGHTPASRDRNGDVISPRKDVRIVVGLLPGVRACGRDIIRRELLALRSLKEDYNRVLPPDGPTRTSAVKALSVSLAGQAQRIELAKRLLGDGDSFEKSELGPIVFLSKDQGTRIRLAQLIHQRQGSAIGRAAAKEWVQEQDRSLATANGVAKLDL